MLSTTSNLLSLEILIVTVCALRGWPAQARPGAEEREDACSLTGTGTVCRVRIGTVEVIVAGADAGGRRGGTAVGGAWETGPLSLLRLVAPRGTGCVQEEEGHAHLPSLQKPILHTAVRIWPFPSRSWPLHLLDCGGHAGIA